MGFFDSFMGKDQRKDIQGASAQAQQQYQTGLRDFTNTTQDYLGQSMGLLEPYAQQGQQANNLFGDYLGTNGQDARASFFSDFAQLPGEFQAAQDHGIRALDRSAAARGGLYSGAQLENLMDFGMKNYNDFLQPYLGHLQGASQQGLGVAGTQAGLTSQAGSDIANAQFGTSQLMANNDINTGNAMAQSRSIPINNLLATLNTVANFIPGGGSGSPGQQTPAWDTRSYSF